MIPISIIRVFSISTSVSNSNFTFHYSNTEIYTQVEMTWALINATALCLHNFLRFANSGVMDLTVGTGGVVTTMYGPGGSYGNGKSSVGRSKQQRSNNAHNLKGFESVKMSNLGRSHHSANAAHADSISMASDSSQRNIVVRHTVDVQYGPQEGASQRGPTPQPGSEGKF